MDVGVVGVKGVMAGGKGVMDVGASATKMLGSATATFLGSEDTLHQKFPPNSHAWAYIQRRVTRHRPRPGRRSTVGLGLALPLAAALRLSKRKATDLR